MLRFLGVRHLAVIDELEVELEPGLNLITGETGAGKSVLVEAIDLLLGARASADLVRTGEHIATVQAIFEMPDGTETVVRREISAQGRSRAFINDALATTAALREFGRLVVDLHGQHEHQTLLDPAGHGSLVDATLEAAQLQAVAEAFHRWRAAAALLSRSTMDAREKRGRIELSTYHLQEIDKVRPEAGEDARLESERLVLASADRLSRLADEAYAALYDGEHAALASLGVVWKRVTDLAAIDARFAPYVAEREPVKSSLDDLAFFLREYASKIDRAPDRLQAVEDRRAALDRLLRKYGPTLDDVLARRAALVDELAGLEMSDERVADLQREAAASRAAFIEIAGRLRAARLEGARQLAKRLTASLADLAMPHAVVDIRVTPLDSEDAWTPAGMDHVEIFLSANPGEDVRPLSHVASGGELSRIMLALHTLDSSNADRRTLVFDEVDAGIGGAAADAVGQKLADLSTRAQVICITHLAQIAARRGVHFQIAKLVRAGRTTTLVNRLDREGRELEIARMIAGAKVSKEALASARELIESRGESETKPKGESPPAVRSKGRARGA